jgi:hypothetical protein
LVLTGIILDTGHAFHNTNVDRHSRAPVIGSDGYRAATKAPSFTPLLS